MERVREDGAALKPVEVRRRAAADRRAGAERRAAAARLRWELAELQAGAVAHRLERTAALTAQPVKPR